MENKFYVFITEIRNSVLRIYAEDKSQAENLVRDGLGELMESSKEIEIKKTIKGEEYDY